MYNFFNFVIDTWCNNFTNKNKLAYECGVSLPTVYSVCKKDGYNVTVISKMWVDIQEILTDEKKLEIMSILNLF